ncbi:hypothetical protein ACLB2K_035039 [Fragaria x ananassa]
MARSHARAAAFACNSYPVWLLSLKKVEPRAFMATMSTLWGLRNHLTILQKTVFALADDCSMERRPARVWIEHQIASPVKQAFLPMLFEFGEGKDLTTAVLTFKYERMCGFCKVYGLLEHYPGRCKGPLNMSEAVLCYAQLTASLYFLQKSAAPRHAPVPILTIVVPKHITPMLSGKKRSTATFMLEDLGKHSKSNATVEEDGVAEFRHVLELSLPHLAFTLVVISPPKKRKVGHQYGSKNNLRVVLINPWKLEANAKAKSSKKRSFDSARRTLTMGDEDSASTALEIMVVEAIKDLEDVPSM